jgi:hypothetical protein
MDKRRAGTVDFLNAIRFGIFMAAEAKGTANRGGDALNRLFERERRMLVQTPQ